MGRGVKQGDPLSPNRFDAAAEEIIFKSSRREGKGLNANGRSIRNLRFADIVVISEDFGELKVMAEEPIKESARVGFSS